MSVFQKANILLPREGTDLRAFACVACDQFTGDPAYWQKAEEIARNKPSALHLIFPEIYLGQDDAVRTEQINRTMQAYLADGVLREETNCLIYVERTLASGAIRRGLVGVCDLEAYDFSPKTRSLIRPTEGTIESRLPARVAIRRHAPLELPHIMLLTTDPRDTVFAPLAHARKTPLYDTDLMLSGGHVRGWRLSESDADEALDRLEAAVCGTKENQILLAVGDGNHSLATAKRCWEEIKRTLSPAERENHPARFALCEVVNLHDPSLAFEPIHRVVYRADTDALLAFLRAHEAADGQNITVLRGKTEQTICLKQTHELPVGTLQALLDAFLEQSGEIDYVHEEDTVRAHAQRENTVEFLIPGMNKSDLFPAVLAHGALPRKTFSMGLGIDKRYYLECRKIR